MAGTFWSNFGLRFNPNTSGGIDELLEKGEGNFTLEEIISHEQVIQECKYLNQALCEYLSKPHVVKQLIQYVIAPPPPAAVIPPNTNTLDVGGSSDNDGGITTAASMVRRKEKARREAEAAAAKQAKQETTHAEPASSASGEAAPTSTNDEVDELASTQELSSDDDDDEDSSDDDATAVAAEKYPYQASELFSCEVSSMLDAIFEPEDPSHTASDLTSPSFNQTLDKVDEEDGSATEKTESSPVAAGDASIAASSDAAAAPASPNMSADAASSPSSATAPANTTPRLPILDLLLSFLDQPAPIDPAHASYFRKVMVVLIQRKYEPLVRYMAAHGTLDKLLRHIGLYSIMELLIMIGWDDGLGGNQDVAWLVANDLTGKLIEKLNPVWETEHHQPDVLINASRALVDVVVKCPANTHNPLITRLLARDCQQLLFKHMFSGSMLSLSNALSIVIVLVQRYANRMDLGEEVLDEAKAAALAEQAASLDAPEDETAPPPPPAATEANSPPSPTSHLPEPFHSLVPHLARILRLLDSEQPPEEQWSYGRGRAFGETRLKVVELILVLVRCRVVEVEQIFREEGLLAKLLDAFVDYPWNNMLHGLVESIIRTILEFLQDTCLKPALFLEAKLADRVIDAYAKNEEACKKGKGFRLGYTGHLLRTAEVIEQYLTQAESATNMTDSGEMHQPQSRESILGSKEAVERWNAFVAGPLAAESEACKVILPSMGGPGDDFDHDAEEAEAALANMESMASGHYVNAKSSPTGDAQEYAFDPDGDSSSLAYDYSSQMEVGDGNNWADFNSHFAEASIGESPGASSPTHEHADPDADGEAGGARSAAVPIQRQLMEFTLNPDEDADEPEDAAQDDDWANFDAATPAPLPPVANASATPATDAATTTAPTSSPNGFDDFAADFSAAPPAQ